MERSETQVPSNSLNYTSVSGHHGDMSHDDNEDEDEVEDSMQEEFERMKLDDSALSTAVTGKTSKVRQSFFYSMMCRRPRLRHKQARYGRYLLDFKM